MKYNIQNTINLSKFLTKLEIYRKHILQWNRSKGITNDGITNNQLKKRQIFNKSINSKSSNCDIIPNVNKPY